MLPHWEGCSLFARRAGRFRLGTISVRPFPSLVPEMCCRLPLSFFKEVIE